jgi:hypothetical protein
MFGTIKPNKQPGNKHINYIDRVERVVVNPLNLWKRVVIRFMVYS